MLVVLLAALRPVNILINDPSFVSDGFTFVKRHQAALIQRLKSVEPVLEHLREQNVLCKFLFLSGTTSCCLQQVVQILTICLNNEVSSGSMFC